MPDSGRMITFPANGGTGQGYLAEATGGEKKPGVVVIQEWWGLDDHIKDVTDRFAAAGFVALAPDLYHGQVATEPDAARKLAMELEVDHAIKEIAGAVKTLADRSDVSGVGTIGFCLGGRLSFLAAARIPEVGASVVCYGSGPAEEDIAKIDVPVLGLYAQDDPNITPNVPNVSAAMAANGKSFTYNIYPDTHHAFFNDTRPEIYNAEAAADLWKWSTRFIRQNVTP